MNERIRELADQATTEEHDGFLYFDKEKFAELIVRECANINFRHTIGLTSDQCCEVSSLIEKHFGVEQ